MTHSPVARCKIEWGRALGCHRSRSRSWSSALHQARARWAASGHQSCCYLGTYGHRVSHKYGAAGDSACWGTGWLLSPSGISLSLRVWPPRGRVIRSQTGISGSQRTPRTQDVHVAQKFLSGERAAALWGALQAQKDCSDQTPEVAGAVPHPPASLQPGLAAAPAQFSC